MAPYDNPDDNFLFEAIGRMVVAWGHLEFTIDAMVLIIHNGLEQKRVEPEKPRSLQKKLSYLSNYFKSINLDETALSDYRRLISDIKIASAKRHDIIHGVAVQHTVGSGKIDMVRLIHDGDGFRKKPFTVTVKMVGEAVSEANHLNHQLRGWVMSVASLAQELNELLASQRE